MMIILLLILLLQTGATVLENAYVLVTKNGAPCASADTPGCEDRVVVALSEIELEASGRTKKMVRGDIAVFRKDESFTPPSNGDWVEVAFKPNHPPVKSPKELIPPQKNTILYDAERFFVFEEKLDPGDVRPRHSHSQRVVVVHFLPTATAEFFCRRFGGRAIFERCEPRAHEVPVQSPYGIGDLAVPRPRSSTTATGW